MPAMEQQQSSTIICRGGLDSNKNWLYLSETMPGAAAKLVNFEPSLFGGYRRIDGYVYLEDTDTGEVDPNNAEGKIYGVAIYDNDTIIAARKQQSGATYNFYEYVPSAAWSAYTTGLTLTSTDVDKLRHHNWKFDGTAKIGFVDGVNNLCLYNGTSWVHASSGDTGADFANAGGAQILDAPSLIHVWENHIFISGDSSNANIIAHSAPLAEYDWTSASGAGQIDAGFDVLQIYPFRDKLFVFGDYQIKYIFVDANGNFAIEDVTSDLGLYATDTVIEVNGDLLFLTQDGIRPISATERNGDFEISSVSKAIQQDLKELVADTKPNEIHSVIIPSKSQFRYFYSDESVADSAAYGVVGGLKNYEGNFTWEFGLLYGIRCSCATWGYYGTAGAKDEYILHGGHDGKVYRQEQGNSFNGSNISADYHTPYLDFGAPSIRKTPKKVTVFARPEGTTTVNVSLVYDWGIQDRLNPSGYNVQTVGSISEYGQAVYGTDTYGGVSAPTMFTNVQGSGQSMQLRFSTNDTNASYSIQSIVVVFEDNGFK